MRFTLGLTGLYERFEGRIFSAGDVARGKPAPDLFLHAAATAAPGVAAQRMSPSSRTAGSVWRPHWPPAWARSATRAG